MKTAPKTQPEPTPVAPPPGRAALACFAASVASGLLLWSCYQPIGWGFLGWIALTPLLLLVRTKMRPTLIYLSALIGGLAFFVPALSWMRVAHSSMAAAWIALAFYCALYFPLAIGMIRALDRRRVPLMLSVPLVWIALEFLRCHFLSGFSWYLLAHTQHDWLPMIQIADLGGVFVVSFLVAAVNAFVFDCAYQFADVGRWFNQTELEPYRYYSSIELLNRSVLADCLFRRNLLIEGTILAVLLIGTYSYGVFQLGHHQLFAGPTVSLLQSDIDQRLREGIGAEKDGDKVAQAVTEHFAALCVRATQNVQPKPDLIIWPETSFPSSWIDVSPKLPIEQVPTEWRDAALDIRGRLKDLAGKHTQIPHLLGMNSYCLEADGKNRHYNSAIFLSEKGQVEDRFDKIHRVPFGEYIPVKDWLPFLALLSPYKGDFGVQAGEKLTRFKINKHRFGVLICYEDTDPFLARRYVEESEEGPPVDFLVNISNDGWFAGSAEHEEHLAVSRFRAIECRRSLVRAVNMGVSAVIDSNGRVLKPTFYPGSDAPLPGSKKASPPMFVVQADVRGFADLGVADWHHFKKRAMVVTATVPIDHRMSVYALVGDVLPIGCWGTLVTGMCWWLWRRRSSSPLVA